MGEKKHKLPKIKVCVGDHCAKHESKKLARKIKDILDEESGEKQVRLKKCDCMGSCKKGPLVLAPWADLTFEHASPEDARKIVQAALDVLQHS